MKSINTDKIRKTLKDAYTTLDKGLSELLKESGLTDNDVTMTYESAKQKSVDTANLVKKKAKEYKEDILETINNKKTRS